MMSKLALALCVALPLGASATYTSEANTKFTSACVNAYKITNDQCDDNEVGKTQCDADTDCNTFVRNNNDGNCYLFNIPPGALEGCTEDSPAAVDGTHTLFTDDSFDFTTPTPTSSPTATPTGAPTTATPTGAPTTALFAQCASKGGASGCRNIDGCFWISGGGPCVVDTADTEAPTAAPTPAATDPPTPAPTAAPTPAATDPTDAPTTAEYAACGRIQRGAVCKRKSMCSWVSDMEGNKMCMSTDLVTDAPTTVAYATCGYERKAKKCVKLDDCSWIKESKMCVVTASITAAPTPLPTPAPTAAPITGGPTKAPSEAPTDAPTTVEYLVCGYESDRGRCRALEECSWVGTRKMGICVTTASITAAPTPLPTPAPTAAPTTGGPTKAPSEAPTDAPTTVAYATCGYQRNSKKCARLDGCSWIKKSKMCVVTASITAGPTKAPSEAPTGAPTTVEYATCGNKNKRGCKRAAACSWDGDMCMSTGLLTPAPTTAAEAATACQRIRAMTKCKRAEACKWTTKDVCVLDVEEEIEPEF